MSNGLVCMHAASSRVGNVSNLANPLQAQFHGMAGGVSGVSCSSGVTRRPQVLSIA